jgi:hypothetical protein
MPVVSVKAKARITAIFMAITLDLWSFSGLARDETPNRRLQSP